MQLPKYVRASGGYLRFQRDIPTRLCPQADGKKTFTHPLGIPDTKIDEAELMRKRAEALDAFDLQIRLLENSDPEAFSANDEDIGELAGNVDRQTVKDCITVAMGAKNAGIKITLYLLSVNLVGLFHRRVRLVDDKSSG